jgi:3-methyladenine DNA glycosylase AlkC
MTILGRKGSKNLAGIPLQVLELLNKGEIETVNLMEWLAVDQLSLLTLLLKEHFAETFLVEIKAILTKHAKDGANTKVKLIGQWLGAQPFANATFLKTISLHPSDTIRNWASYAVLIPSHNSFQELLERIKPFAADNHFGVREVAWMALRPFIGQNLIENLTLLEPWCHSPNENLRRFVSEATRPRGVWCAHIEALKTDPSLGLFLLEPLKEDPSRYVQNSVANWLNDAAKTQAKFVLSVCDKWGNTNNKATEYIIKRSLRSIK